MSTLSMHAYPSPTQGTWILPQPQGSDHPVSRLLGKLTGPQNDRIRLALDRISRGETGGANFTWIDFSITIRWVAGRLVLSLFSHDQFGSVVGYVVDEIVEDGVPGSIDFANRRWAERN